MAELGLGVDAGSEGLTVQQAAAVAGVSERTVRRWLKEGRLAAEKVPTAQGYEWRVEVPGAGCPPPRPARRLAGGAGIQVPGAVPGAAVPAAEQVEHPAGEALVRALALVERLQRENLELAGRVGFLQGQLQETQAQLLALAPPAPQSARVADGRRDRLWASWWRLRRARSQGTA